MKRIWWVVALGLFGGLGCRQSPSKAAQALTPQEAAGQKVFLNQCSSCHYFDSDRGLYGPGLAGLFRKPTLPSGMAANDARVSSVIRRGWGMMPAVGNTLSDQELAELLAYLHTL